MAFLHRARTDRLFVIVALGLALGRASVAMDAPGTRGRFAALALADPAAARDVATMPDTSLSSAARAGWDAFRAAHGREWTVWLDRRSGAPLLVEGKGIPWAVDAGATVDSIAASLRPFVAANRSLLLVDDAELVLDREGSGPLIPDVWQIVFDRVVAGVLVDGERYVFTIGHGKLISFGSPRWSRIDAAASPDIEEAAARARLMTYMNLTKDDAVEDRSPPRLQFIPLRAGMPTPGSGYYRGAIGSGYSSALVWRFSVGVAGDPGTWTAQIDAHTGAIRSFVDEARYVRLKGGIFPLTDDQICPSGCEQPNYPLPFATVTIGAASPTTSSTGMFVCSPAGATATTALTGPYVKIVDTCGPIFESTRCSTSDMDLGTSPDTNCNVQSGASAGNTRAARSTFYHVNRAAEHGRPWLPTRPWLSSQITATVNETAGCLGGWISGALELGWGAGSCNNAGENAGVLYHEWGHGLDENDGGGYDDPTEGYADVNAVVLTHGSCVARGFLQSGFCGPAGNPCLTCTGAREDDWNAHAAHTPATPTTWAAAYCDLTADGPAPCGFEQHCEGQLLGETIWDLATRDLPSTGMSQASAWQLVDRLWYTSRLGSGGNAYNCSLPDSDSCSATSWFSKIRAVDDDDGNLANGTPHAAQIFAAFNRHALACGTSADPSNQSAATCPVIPAPTLAVAPRPGAAFLSWNAVPNASSYRILRNDLGCSVAMTRLSDVASTSFTDVSLANGFPLYYTVQGLSGNAACDGAVSSCLSVTPQSGAGILSLDADTYACSGAVITVTVVDGNVGTPPTATLTSDTETSPETIHLIRVGTTTTYRNTITTTTAPPAADGLLSVRNGDTITVTYIDGNDGGGGANVPRVTTALATCVTPGVRPVPDGSFGVGMKASRTDGTGTAINLDWDVATCSSTDHHLLYGNLATISSLTVDGSTCNLGTSGSAIWAGVPPGNVWFTIVGDDDATTEGSWGTTGAGAERAGTTASGQCGMTTRDNSGSCP